MGHRMGMDMGTEVLKDKDRDRDKGKVKEMDHRLDRDKDRDKGASIESCPPLFGFDQQEESA